MKDYPSLMKNLGSVMGIEILYDEVEHIVNVGESVEYDLECSAVEALFAEVLFVVNMANHPVSFLSFHFESLARISTNYGIESVEYKVAVQMIDAVIAYIQSTYEVHHSLQMTIIYFNDNCHTKDVINAMEPILDSSIDKPIGKGYWSTITEDLPFIFLSKEGKEKINDICEQLSNILDEYSLSVDCFIGFKRHLLQNNSEPSPNPAPGSSPNPNPAPGPSPNPGQPSQEQVALVHMVLWVCIGLICALIQACYRLSVLDGSGEPEFKPKTYEGAGVRSKTTKM